MVQEAKRPILFHMPAARFRNPKAIHKLGSRLTYSQHEMTPNPFLKGYKPITVGVSIPKSDARQMAPMLLGALIPPKNRRARAWLKGARIELHESQILYFPFSRLKLYWKELWTGISFQGNALSEDLPHIEGRSAMSGKAAI